MIFRSRRPPASEFCQQRFYFFLILSIFFCSFFSNFLLFILLLPFIFPLGFFPSHCIFLPTIHSGFSGTQWDSAFRGPFGMPYQCLGIGHIGKPFVRFFCNIMAKLTTVVAKLIFKFGSNGYGLFPIVFKSFLSVFRSFLFSDRFLKHYKRSKKILN